MKTFVVTVSSSTLAPSWDETTCPTWILRKKTGEPTSIAPARSECSSNILPGSDNVTTGATSRPLKLRLPLPSWTGSRAI